MGVNHERRTYKEVGRVAQRIVKILVHVRQLVLRRIREVMCDIGHKFSVISLRASEGTEPKTCSFDIPKSAEVKKFVYSGFVELA